MAADSDLLLVEPRGARNSEKLRSLPGLLSVLIGLSCAVLLTSYVRRHSASKLVSESREASATRPVDLDKTALLQAVPTNRGSGYAASAGGIYRPQYRSVAAPAFSMSRSMYQYGTVSEPAKITRFMTETDQSRDVSAQAGGKPRKNKKADRKQNKDRGAGQSDENESSDTIIMVGKVTNVLSNGFFRVELENGIEILGTLSGKMRQNKIWVELGDNVKVDISPYDLTRGRIIFRQIPNRRPFPK
eukprot:gnl/TRDRNA2_/TRDRNA2_174839_c3_seq21.p1 gnl/TRDRNA2_/TRDRNA2_174839_c3~~gnl/TRDRNA2_/TRDRNA2_174839_c3_seq21.p1  ORF type:complete len:245 (+),score=37.16 gnl/TRDRNA2_/TRDRNA2_174839_c3_seq21:105-839(+)